MNTTKARTQFEFPWPLPNLKPVSAADFWREVTMCGCPPSIRVPTQCIDGSWAAILAFNVNRYALTGGGFAVFAYYSGPKAGTQEYATYTECEHTWTTQNLGRCYNGYTCSKCGANYTVDSSD